MSSPYLGEREWQYAEDWPVEDEALREARERAAEWGITTTGRAAAGMLQVLAASIRAQAIIDIGTGTGISGAALLAGMPVGGILTSIDTEAEYQRAARETFTEMGLPVSRARLIVGRALDVLPRMSDGAYDMVVVDGDRSEYPAALIQAKRLLRVGGLAVFLGVLDNDTVADPSRRDPDTMALRDVVEQVQQDDDWVATLATVGNGMLIASLQHRSD